MHLMDRPQQTIHALKAVSAAAEQAGISSLMPFPSGRETASLPQRHTAFDAPVAYGKIGGVTLRQ